MGKVSDLVEYDLDVAARDIGTDEVANGVIADGFHVLRIGWLQAFSVLVVWEVTAKAIYVVVNSHHFISECLRSLRHVS